MVKAAIRDAWFHKGRSAVVFLSVLIITVFPIGFSALSPSLSESICLDSKELHLAHLDLRISPMDPSIVDLVHDFYADQGLNPEGISGRIFAYSLSLKVEHEWVPFEMISVDHVIDGAVNDVRLKQGDDIVNAGEALLLESAGKKLGIDIGDNVTINSVSGPMELKVVGYASCAEFMSYDLYQTGVLFVKCSDMYRYYGIEAPVVNSIAVRFHEDTTLGAIKAANEGVREFLEATGASIMAVWYVREMSVRKGVETATDFIASYMRTSSVLMIAIGGVVIYIVMSRYAFENRKLVGVFKSFGFSDTQIAVAFAARTLILSSMASATGGWLGIMLARGMTHYISDLWELNTYTVVFSVRSVVLVVLAANVVALIFSHVSLRRYLKLEPYESLRGASGAKVQTAGARVFTVLPLNVRYAARNLTRNRQRTVLMATAVIIALTFSYSLLQADHSVMQTLDDQYENEILYNHVVYYKTLEYDDSMEQQIAQLSEVVNVEPYFRYAVQVEGKEEFLMYFRGISETSTLHKTVSSEGKSFEELEADEALVSRYQATILDVGVEDTITVFVNGVPLNYTVAGISSDVELVASLQVKLEQLWERLGGVQIHNACYLGLEEVSDEREEEIEDWIVSIPEVSAVIAKHTGHQRQVALVESQTVITYLMVFLGLAVAFLVIFSTMFIVVVEREWEISLMRAFGVGWTTTGLQLFYEMTLVSAFSLGVSYGTGRLMTRYWTETAGRFFFEINMHFGWFGIVFIAGFLLLTIMASVGQALLHNSQINLAERLRTE